MRLGRCRPVGLVSVHTLKHRGLPVHSTKLVILGRDGVLNAYRDDHVKAPEEWQALPGALEAVSRLNHAGWHTVVATNGHQGAPPRNEVASVSKYTTLTGGAGPLGSEVRA